MIPDSDNTPEGWSSRDKFAAVLETESLNETELAETAASVVGTRSRSRPGERYAKGQNDWDQEQSRRDKQSNQAERKRVKELERELKRKEKALAETAALLVLRKKANAIWGKDEDE